MKSFIYYLLQFTYGILMNAIGLIVFLITICFTHNVQKNVHSFYTTISKMTAGFSLGIFCFVGKNSSQYLINHETGHTYQNIIFGPLMLILVDIPSVIRYWYRKGKKNLKTGYYDIWFEKQASDLGTKAYEKWSQKHVS